MKKYKTKTRAKSGRDSVKNRFKITATGKVLRRRQNSRHLRRKKSKKAKRKYGKYVEVKGKMAKKVKQMLGLA